MSKNVSFIEPIISIAQSNSNRFNGIRVQQNTSGRSERSE
jgi:hypothetical protein